jgi:hypothetical protein
LLNQAFKFINNPNKANTPTRNQVIVEDNSKEDIYYDPEKKRYVLKGEIPVN